MYLIYTALVIVIAVAIVIVIAKTTANHAFECKHCNKSFRIKWTKVLVTEHSDKEYMLLCPYCKVKDWCTET